MGCSHSIREDSENEFNIEDLRIKTKQEGVIHRLNFLKKRAEKINDKKVISHINWIKNAVQDGNLTEPIEQKVDDTQEMDVLKNHFLKNYSELHRQDLHKKNIMATQNNPNTKAKYMKFINKFKKSVNDVINEYETKDEHEIKVIPNEKVGLLADQMKNLDCEEFDIWEVNSLIDKKTTYFVLNQIFVKNGFFKGLVNENKFINFVTEIINGYDRKVPYHNDLHAADVLQVAYVMMEKGKLIRKLNFNQIDTLAVYLSAICHDFKHNGFNNAYHINIHSEIAITYNDSAVLENYHVSETFRTLLKKDNNLLDSLTSEEYQIVRRRMIDGILATDMAAHMRSQTTLKAKFSSFEILNGKNVELLITDDVAKTYENTQIIINSVIHTADVSNPAKSWEGFMKWVDVLFVEFFAQGDLEKAKGFPPSMLCDRKTTDIYKSEIGFIQFVVIPQFEILSNVIPDLTIYRKRLVENMEICRKKSESAIVTEKSEKNDKSIKSVKSDKSGKK